MAQSYFPSKSSPVVPQIVSEDTQPSEPHMVEKLVEMNGQDVQANYVEHKDRLVEAIDATKGILHDLRTFNKESWVVRYPTISPATPPATSCSSTTNLSVRPKASRRSLTFMDDPSVELPIQLADVPSKRGTMRRSMTMADLSTENFSHEEPSPVEDCTEDKADEEGLVPVDFNVLRLDLTLGPHGSSVSAGALVSQLEKASIANLIDERISSSMKHMDKLRARIEDTSSKVLVTGDLNAGKSTFVNALLRRDILPVDQQPCTTMFLEVHPATDNDGKEEVHVVNEGAVYSRSDESTFTRAEIADLEGIVTESDPSRTLRLYINDPRNPSDSLLQNGIVDISLVDAPGLNRDSIQTTALFARQEEIDVVVFVVSAENHFTLSSKEFLFTASNEKAYIFIVVNKFDGIRDKARCKRMILEQIKALSPRTWDDAENLVHFVDSSSALARATVPDVPRSSSVPAETFDELETSLRSFVLCKRAKSKLMPASTYLSKLLQDIDLLATTNGFLAQKDLEQAKADIDRARPVLEQMKSGRQALEEGLDNEEDLAASTAMASARQVLEKALVRVGNGEIAVDKQQLSAFRKTQRLPTMPTYPGLLGVWGYAGDVKRTLLASLDLAVEVARDQAREITAKSVENVATIGQVHLPQGTERSHRVFMPEAMFAARRGAKNKRHSVVAGGIYGLGIGLAQRHDLLEVTFQDIFDLQHHLTTHFGGDQNKSTDDDDTSGSSLQVIGWGLTALGMVGGRTMGLRSLLHGFARVNDVLGSDRSRKWVAPILGVATLGLAVYIVIELPYTIPRTIGRQLRAKLVSPSGAIDHASVQLLANPVREECFAAWNVSDIGKETRKVVRLASFELRDTFRAAMEERTKEVVGAEEMERRARRALEWFVEVEGRTEEVRVKAELVL